MRKPLGPGRKQDQGGLLRPRPRRAGRGRGEHKDGAIPHMVLLVHGDFMETYQWHCGGTIISEKFVLTAAQCTIKDEVIYVRTATVKKSDALDPKRLYKVARIVRHPDYNEVEDYNDIALLETQTEMLLDRLAMPACLPVGDSYNDSSAVALGFGTVGFGGKFSDSLSKVVLTKFSSEECAKHYKPASDLPYGIKGNIHLCYGDKIVSRDTCTGDAGGPLHIDNKDVHCMFRVIGIISFGIACGIIGVPGVYTRVAAYTPWIESIVWPD
ncbi:Clotting factor B [Eumeta japonica]|uniref:Clotting factor B n=1 Tax=Eumeta variegata TaxID=151549 RepID=A0A4C1X9R5_EUMVA|nr:Clotting factor B [Eumeta japonica]